MKPCSLTALINLWSLFLVVWMSLSLRNAFSTLKNSLRAVKSARPWKSSFHSGICSTDNMGCIITHLYSYLTCFVLFFPVVSLSRLWWRQPMKICQQSSATGCWNSSPSFSSSVSLLLAELISIKKSYIRAEVCFKWTGSYKLSPDHM